MTLAVKSAIALIFISLSLITNAADILSSGQRLNAGSYIQSLNGEYTLFMQTDGSLVMYRKNGSVRYRMAKRGTHAIMQTDGNFVEYHGDSPLWSSKTDGHPRMDLRIRDDGDLQIGRWSEGFTMVIWGIDPDPDAPVPGKSRYPLDDVSPAGAPPAIIPAINYPDTTTDIIPLG